MLSRRRTLKHLDKIAEINQTSGGLFDAIPNEVFGNIKSSDGNENSGFGIFWCCRSY